MPSLVMHAVNAVAERYGVKPDAVRGWIASGELAAIDVSRTRGKLPRWRIPDDALDAFEQGRSTIKPRKKTSKKRADLPDDFVTYF